MPLIGAEKVGDKVEVPVDEDTEVARLLNPLPPMAREEFTELRPTWGRLPEEVEVPVLDLPEDVK